MPKQKEQLIMAKDDHAIIMSYIKNGSGRSMLNRQEAERLEAELTKAVLVEKTSLPEDVVCLNSTVLVKEDRANTVMELTLVTPEKADIKQRKISILSPIAAALIGFRKGRKVVWRVPAGLKTFCILDVHNSLQSV